MPRSRALPPPAAPAPAQRRGDPALAARLAREIAGEVHFDAFARGRYATDASIYQIEPLGVVVPAREEDVAAVAAIAAEEQIPLLARGAGTSQGGQAVGEALVIDFTKYLNNILEVDEINAIVTVQPGLVLDELNRRLRPHGLFFPVDPSTASRATLGGMAGNNSCGARSIRYGNMVHNVHAIEAVLADGGTARFAELPADLAGAAIAPRIRELATALRGIARREREELARRFPKLLRRVGGYNLDALTEPSGHNLARLLVGSEGTLALSTRLELMLAPLPAQRALGVCHFPDFRAAMEATRHIVELGPTAVELVDRTLLDLAADIPLYRESLERFVRGAPEALLLVEFAGEDGAGQRRALGRLGELLGTLGFPGAVVEVTEPALQAEVWEVRKAGLNIMTSMKGDAKPVSFIEDCAVSLADLPEYTARLDEIFARHGTRGTWYAHASVGCLHVRPMLNMKDAGDVTRMRAIAEETFAMVRAYQGSHSGEHGDGLVRSEFHEAMFGPRIARAFEEVKDLFDPRGLLNPGKIVRAPRMDDRRLFRYRPGYRAVPLATALDWSAWGGLAGAAEMCNNNGACRNSRPGVMCPSFRATGDEQHLTRGRANSLRLALTGQLGPGALESEAMRETLDLCLSCKACRRECPAGVDMARMKIEVLHQYRRHHPPSARERLIAWLPRYAPWAARLAPLANLRGRVPGLAALGEKLLGISARRPLPRWRRDALRAAEAGGGHGTPVVLFADTFTTWYEPDNARAAIEVLHAAGCRVQIAQARGGRRPPCCGRTFLAAGLVEQARAEMRRLLDALAPAIERGTPVIGLEPSCLYTLRDELPALLPGERSEALAARAVLLEEYLAAAHAAGRLSLELQPLRRRALLHGHCHQQAFGGVPAARACLGLVPGLELEVLESGCCGMAGAFGYEAEHHDLSLRIGALGPLPAVCAAAPETLIVADGTSCRQQFRDAAGREALHAARVLAMALPRASQARRATGERITASPCGGTAAAGTRRCRA